MNSLPLVSGIITTYKREPDLVRRAAKSILNQTYSNIELVIVDDSPEDYVFRNEVEKAVSQLKGNIIYIKNPVNMGACESRNRGIQKSNGVILGFLDDDDEWHISKVENMISYFKDASVGLVYCGAISIDEKGYKKAIITEWKSGYIYNELLFYNFIGSTSFPLVRRETIIKAGLFDTHLRSSQDHDMWLRVSLISKVMYERKVLVNYYIHSGDQITKNKKAVLQGQEYLFHKYLDDIKRDKRTYWKRTSMLASAYSNNHQIMKALYYWLMAVIRDPIKLYDNCACLYHIMVK